MQVLIVFDLFDEKHHGIKYDQLKAVAFRPFMKALCFEDEKDFEEAKKKLNEIGEKYELL
jgi:hypothetical protein